MKKSFFLGTAALLPLIAFANDAVETVQIQGKGGPFTVNKSDFDADQAEGGEGKMKLYKPTAKETKEAAKSEQQDADQAHADEVIESFNPGVVNEGKLFFVIDQNNEGKRVTKIKGINAKGYNSAKEAWDAVQIVRTQQTGAGGSAPAPLANADDNNDSG